MFDVQRPTLNPEVLDALVVAWQALRSIPWLAYNEEADGPAMAAVAEAAHSFNGCFEALLVEGIEVP